MQLSVSGQILAYLILKTEFISSKDNENSICIDCKESNFDLFLFFLGVWAVIIYHCSINLHNYLKRPTYHLVRSSLSLA